MKYIAFPIDEIDTVMEICVGEVNRYKDMEKDGHPNFGALLIKSKWEGKVEALGEMLKFGKECNEIK
jgi:hypothetical protein